MLSRQAPGEVSEGAALTEGIRPEALDERQIEDLIAEHLQQHLEILPEQDLANALHEFVDKVMRLPWQSDQRPNHFADQFSGELPPTYCQSVRNTCCCIIAAKLSCCAV